MPKDPAPEPHFEVTISLGRAIMRDAKDDAAVRELLLSNACEALSAAVNEAIDKGS